MTENTSPTKTAPAWLDIDKLISPEIRAELAAVTKEGRALEPALRALSIRAKAVYDRYVEAVHTGQDLTGVDLFELVEKFVPEYPAFWEMLSALTGHLQATVPDTDFGELPDWAKS